APRLPSVPPAPPPRAGTKMGMPAVPPIVPKIPVPAIPSRPVVRVPPVDIPAPGITRSPDGSRTKPITAPPPLTADAGLPAIEEAEAHLAEERDLETDVREATGEPAIPIDTDDAPSDAVVTPDVELHTQHESP